MIDANQKRKPVKPSKPSEFIHDEVVIELHDTNTLQEILDMCKNAEIKNCVTDLSKLGLDDITVLVLPNPSSNYEGYDVAVTFPVEKKNTRYNSQLKQYEAKLETYNKQLKEYNEYMKAEPIREKERIAREIRSAEIRLKKLKIKAKKIEGK